MNIQHITMYTSNVEAMKRFYSMVLHFPLKSEDSTSFTIQAGKTSVTFTKAAYQSEPFYHFAFDIPANQFEEAKAWTKERVTLLQEQQNDEVYFPSIDAKSFYFEDPTGNIVEFICRFSDAEVNEATFKATSIQKVSEMSLVVRDKLRALPTLESVSIFERDRQPVAAQGLDFMGTREDASYLLFVNEGRRWFFSHKKATMYPLHITLDDGVSIEITENLELTYSKSI